MKFVKNNREVIVLALVIAAVFVGVAGIAEGTRGGQAWLYNSVSLNPVDLLASLLK